MLNYIEERRLTSAKGAEQFGSKTGTRIQNSSMVKLHKETRSMKFASLEMKMGFGGEMCKM